ncbi:Cilia- and flagella-associated protein 57 [Geranomyces variabilis]|nr:Cilia- and flagella-associated protein 57 [Geranomyces variabilis]
MSIAAVAHRHVFGYKGDVNSAIAYLDEQTVIYPVGHNSVLYNTESKLQKFIPVTEKCEAITAMAVSTNKRYIAIAERGEKPLCALYDLHTLRRRKTLSTMETESKDFVCIAFSADAKYILTQTGAPDWTLFYWSWEKAKVMASVKTAALQTDRTTTLMPTSSLAAPVVVPSSRDAGGSAGQGSSPAGALATTTTALASSSSPAAAARGGGSGGGGDGAFGSVVYQVSFNPSDNTQVCVIGNGIFKLFRYQEGLLKLFSVQKLEPKNYLSHCWAADDRIIVGTEDAKILIFEQNGELRTEISHTFGPNSVPRTVSTLLGYSKGFICGGSHGSMAIYERNEDANAIAALPPGQREIAGREMYRKVKELTMADDNARVTNMAISPSEDNFVATTETNQIFALMLAGTEVKGEESRFEIFSQPFHHGQITGCDTCIRKPLVVTCSTDRSVRVWNYLDSTSELVKYFPEEAFSVAIHPSGLYILVGFSDKLRLMNLLIDDIRTFREFTIRGCRECRFSNGGQYFAAVHGNTIQIYSTWNFENLGNLKGHNGKVRSLFWTQDDSRIVSAGMDGAIYDWALRDLSGSAGSGGGIKREGESILKSCNYTCAIATADGRSIFAVGSDKTLKEITDSQIVRELESNVVLTQVILSQSGRMMFVGTANGTIRSMKFPLSNEAGEFQEHQAHSAPITKLRVSFDDQYLFSTSEDGALYVFKISDKEGRGLKRDREIVYADEILVTKSDLEEKNSTMAELKTRVEELKMENEYQLRLKDMNFNEKIKEVTEKFMQEIEALKITSTVLRTDKEKEEVRHEEEMGEERERHARELSELETVHNAKLMAEYERYQELQGRTTELQVQWERQMREMQAAKEKALAELTAHFEARVREKQAEIDQLQSELHNQYLEFTETTKETEQDADTEILEIKHRYEKKLKEEREIGLRLKGENGIMRKKFNTLNSEIDAHKTEIGKMFNEEKKLHGVIKSLEKDILGLKKEILERDETIQDKEKRIYDLKKKNQELEKFKFVLDYKIKELKRQIEPREQDIQGMTHQIKEMDVELEHYHKANSNLELTIADLKLKLRAAEKEVAKEHARVKAFAATVKRFKVDLNECVQYIQEPKLLKTHVKNLYQKYCLAAAEPSTAGLSSTSLASNPQSTSTSTTPNTSIADVQQEYARQREHLERTVASLRRKVTKDQNIHRADNVRIMSENVALIKEINQLRRDLKGTRAREKAAEIALKHSKAGVSVGAGGAAAAGAAETTGSRAQTPHQDAHLEVISALRLPPVASPSPTPPSLPRLEQQQPLPA